MGPHELLKTSWVYSLKKEELTAYLVQCGQDPTGTVDEMRKRLAKFITTDHDEDMTKKLLGWQKYHDQSNLGSPSVALRVPGEKTEGLKPQGSREVALDNPPRVTPESDSEKPPAVAVKEDRVATIELIRKWGLKYDGGKEVLKFADRLEELAGIYEVDLSAVLPVMCELLKDRALVWFRNNHQPWEHWSHFKKDLLDFFLPPRYFEKLELEVRSRTQRPRENFKEYLLALQELMYHANMSEGEKLEIIFRNSSPDYQWYIRRRDFKTLEDLVSLATELESIPTTRQPGRSEHHRMLRDQHSSPTDHTSPYQHPTHLAWKEEKITATIVVNHQPCDAIIDTGATRSFVTPAFVKKLQRKPERTPSDVEVTLADGSKKRITTAVQVPVTFGSLTKNHEFLVMKEATEAIILGLDFLKAFDTSIHCAGLTAKGEAADSETPGKDAPQTQVKKHAYIYSCYNIRQPKEDGIQKRLKRFLEVELPKFDKIQDLSTAATHKIVMKDDRPIKIRYAQRNPAMQAIIDAEVNSLLARGCIEPSRSPYSFPITLVKKKNGSWRTCMDFRQLNARSIPDAYPLPRIDTILDRLRNAKYISCLDLKDGYWQIPMEEGSKKYTAFAVTGRGLYQWRVMPFGLHSAPATFQRALDSVIGADMEPHAFAYLDDIIVLGRTFEEHIHNLQEVFRRLRAANLKINPEKCEFCKSETRYLGHIVTGEGIKTDPEKVAAIIQLPTPQDVKGVRRFLGITSWYRRFVPDFAKISQPLTQLLKKGRHWKWGPEQQQAFEALKNCLTKAPVLACPDFTKPFTLQTDASEVGLGVVLTQEIDEAERVIAYASRHLQGAEKNYSATEKECLAIIWGIRKMRPYLEGYEFRVITDHLSLKWLNSLDNPTGRLARWALELQQYQFSIFYRKGKQNVVADALSRHPMAEINLVQVRPPNSCPWYDGKVEAVRKSPELHADYTLVDNKLYRHSTREVNDVDPTPWKLCVPKYQRQRVLEEAHDQVTGGHMGVRKTINKIAGRYYWPGLARDVSRYVRRCDICQKYKTSQQQPAGKMLTRIQEEPWSLLCADFIGPLPRTAHGNTMLLVLFDNFSKWVELIPCRKATAEGVVRAIRERIVSRYGVPKALITDNGTQFTSRVLRRYLEEMGIKQQFTAPYTPQENPTERANRTIKTMIAQFSGERHNRWDELLPEVMLALNTSTSESTGYSPAFLTQGRNPRLPKALYDEVTIGSGAQCVSPEERADELKDIFKIVRNNLKKASQKQRHHYNLRRRNWSPKIGDHVLVRQHLLSKAVDNFTAKLAPKFKGPYVVTDFVSPVIVRVRNIGNNEKLTAHVSELKPYQSNNCSFSLISSRTRKSTSGQEGVTMESNRKKFERTKQQFRHDLKRENEKARRTIFLEDDEVPCSSSSRTTRRTTPAQSRQKVGPRKVQKEKCCRMTVTSPDKTPQRKTKLKVSESPPEQGQTDSDTVCISDDETPPAPPEWKKQGPAAQVELGQEEPGRESSGDETPPPPPIWTEESFEMDDLEIDSDDLNDSMIREFCRSLWGMNDTTMDRRPPSPPSPSTISSSSLEWESGNFRTPTPPRRRGFVNIEVQDRTYPYLDMQCYERVWRAQILVPTTIRNQFLQQSEEIPRPSSPPPFDYSEPEIPVTPGREWFNSQGCVYRQTPPDLRSLVPPHQDRHNVSPMPSPPPIFTQDQPPEHTPPHMHTITIPDRPTLEQLPEDIRKKITEVSKARKGTRTRFRQEIWGHTYRVTINRNGEVLIIRV